MNGYSLNLSTKTLTITKDFEDAIATGEGKAYDLYTKFVRDIPGLTVIRKTHKTPRKYVSKRTGEVFNCNQFKNLKYENMEGFINGLPNGEDYMTAYIFLKNCASLPQTSRYTAVRKWFVAQFPNFRKKPLFYLYNKVDVIDFTEILKEEQERAAELAAKKAAEQEEKKLG